MHQASAAVRERFQDEGTEGGTETGGKEGTCERVRLTWTLDAVKLEAGKLFFLFRSHAFTHTGTYCDFQEPLERTVEKLSWSVLKQDKKGIGQTFIGRKEDVFLTGEYLVLL